MADFFMCIAQKGEMNNRESSQKVNKNQFQSLIQARKAQAKAKIVKEVKEVDPEKAADKEIRFQAFLDAKNKRKLLKSSKRN